MRVSVFHLRLQRNKANNPDSFGKMPYVYWTPTVLCLLLYNVPFCKLRTYAIKQTNEQKKNNWYCFPNSILYNTMSKRQSFEARVWKFCAGKVVGHISWKTGLETCILCKILHMYFTLFFCLITSASRGHWDGCAIFFFFSNFPSGKS